MGSMRASGKAGPRGAARLVGQFTPAEVPDRGEREDTGTGEDESGPRPKSDLESEPLAQHTPADRAQQGSRRSEHAEEAVDPAL